MLSVEDMTAGIDVRPCRKFDNYERQIVLHDGTKLPMGDILDISGEIFAMIE